MLKRSLYILMVVVVGAVLGIAPTQTAKAVEPTLYNQPGVHYVNGRYWKTECVMYSTNVVRCSTSIWGNKIIENDGQYYDREGWVFNNMTYLPSPESSWAGNNLAIHNARWTDDGGRQWRTECKTPTTGPDACRNYVVASILIKEGGQYKRVQQEVLNSIVQFSTSSVPPQTTILEPATTPPGAPVEEGFVPPVATSVYTQPGDHLVNDRYWHTECAMYSSKIVRCTTDIWATKVVTYAGKYYTHNGWVFNNMTYLPAPKSVWGTNPLANTGIWTASDGRQWKTECNTAATGTNGCRSYAMAKVVDSAGGRFVASNKFVLNNIVMFSTSKIAHQKTIPASAPPLAGVPVEQPFVPPASVTFRADSRCLTGRALCVSKNQRKMAWMVNGQILKVVDVRFGKEGASTETRNGAHRVGWKSRDHVSSIYGTAMPFAMFFDGGQAVHYSDNFRRVGYDGNSAGCVNVRDYDAIKWLFDTQVKVGDKVIVYY
ncbi:L,D-transpeptidase [Tessaracoccus sp. OS52]|uniref:L,D-transpeptidase n=1 Tax=Tessaracoccus sp. OS52 TaxID=2886691 RepID=UPI001D129B4F|nr:L,D-transpeptidase [Tessaracoccus sp. OS52]MCC2594341.1 L,D-transpeptidase [Tessaracoccus sp. OS52]